MIPLALWIILGAPPYVFVAAVGLCAAFCTWELLRMVYPELRRLQILGALIALAGFLVSRYAENNTDLIAVWTLLLMLLAIVGLLSLGKRSEYHSKVAWLLLPPFYIGLPLITLAWLHAEPDGPQWVILALTLAFVADTGGYIVGRLWGKDKLAPYISPNKTIQGALGGLGGSVLAALIAHAWYLPNIPLLNAIMLGIVGGACGQAGDLFESLIKRGFAVKDSSHLIPGHGGLLDRLDAVLFTSACTWLYVQL